MVTYLLRCICSTARDALWRPRGEEWGGAYCVAMRTACFRLLFVVVVVVVVAIVTRHPHLLPKMEKNVSPFVVRLQWLTMSCCSSIYSVVVVVSIV